MLKQGQDLASQSQTNKNINIDLQLALLNTWTKFEVADYYQNIFLLHLDELNSSQAEELIKKEINFTLQKKSPFFQLEKLQKQRKNIIQKLQKLLTQAQRSQSSTNLPEICLQVKQLREINLVLSQQILKMYNIYHCASIQSTDKQMEYYDSMFNDLDRDNQFMKESILSHYLRFDEGYDPFLMAQYQKIHRNKSEAINPAIKDLFKLNISYAYRLIKTKNMILQLRALAKQHQSDSVRETPLSDRLKANQSQFSSRKIYSKAQFSRIKTQSQNGTRKYSVNQISPVKIQPIHIYPSIHAKSRTTIYRERDKEERPESTSITEGNQQLRLKFAKIVSQPPSSAQLSSINFRPYNQKEKVYQVTSEKPQPSKSLDLSKRLRALEKSINNQRKHSFAIQVQPSQFQRPKSYKNKGPVGSIYRSIKLTPLKNKIEQKSNSKQQAKTNQIVPQKSQQKKYENKHRNFEEEPNFSEKRTEVVQKIQEVKLEYNPIFKEVKHYNPIKKQQYQIYEIQPGKSKYDFVPHQNQQNTNLTHQITQDRALKGSSSEQNHSGLIYEEPISKYNLKRKKILAKKTNSQQIANQPKPEDKQPLNSKHKQTVSRVDQQSQTMELRKASTQHSKPEKEESNAKNNEQKKKIQTQKKGQPLQEMQPQEKTRTEKLEGMKKSQKLEENQPQKKSKAQKIEPEKKNQKLEQTQPQKKAKPQKIEAEKKVQPQKKPQAQNSQEGLNSNDPSESEQQSQIVPQPQKKKAKQPNPKKDQIQQDQSIVNQQPAKTTLKKTQSKIVNNSNLKTPTPQEKQPQASEDITPNNRQGDAVNDNLSSSKQKSNSKKQIRMKVGKAHIDQVLQLIKKSKIPEEYLTSFDLEKTLGWIKVSQTYLTEFTVNDETAIIALCSPIPNIGTALKLWVPISSEIDSNAASNLFKKYIEFVEKSTSSQKIMFSGKPFKELQAAQFVLKKENLYERVRKTPSRQITQQFKPFVYIQCSNLKFPNTGKSKMLYSEEIQQFTPQNSYTISFLGQVSDKDVPSSIKPLVKFTQGLQNFKKVNEILTNEDFDNYQTNQIQASNIDLMRFYLNCPLKSTFIAQDSCFKFTGTLLHQKDKECIVAVNLTKNNGNIVFAKNVTFAEVVAAAKKVATAKVAFTVMMFHKKLYGKMPQVEGGCYGNWQINLTWEDELQGRLRHNMTQNISFGSQNFKVLIQLQKIAVLGFQVNKQDLV